MYPLIYQCTKYLGWGPSLLMVDKNPYFKMSSKLNFSGQVLVRLVNLARVSGKDLSTAEG